MPIPSPSRAELEAAEREIMRRRGERALAAELAAREEAADRGRQAQEAAAKPSPPPSLHTPRMQVQFGWAAPKLSEAEALGLAQALRATYSNYADMPEIIELQEAKLAKAFAADGWTLPSLSPDDRLKLLRRQHA